MVVDHPNTAILVSIGSHVKVGICLLTVHKIIIAINDCTFANKSDSCCAK